MKGFKRYLASEIVIEFKACLYFFGILFFYCCYQLIGGDRTADIIVMAEIIGTTYIMGYVQVYLLRNFEESEKLGWFEWGASIGCSLLYGVESYIFSWFDKNVAVSIGFISYMVLIYICMIAIYYLKRHIDTELLNQDLEAFKKQGGKEYEGN